MFVIYITFLSGNVYSQSKVRTEIMKRLILLWVLIVPFTLSAAKLQSDTTTLTPELRHAREAMLVTQLLEYHHYRKMKFEDSLSSAILDSYITALDPNRNYFFLSDIEGFEGYRFKLDNATKKGNVQPAYDIFEVFSRRYYERMDYVHGYLVNKEFDYTVAENHQLDRAEAKWMTSESEMEDMWRKIVKSQKLSLKLSERNNHEDINGIIKKRYDRYVKTIRQYKSDDVFQLYMNVVAKAYDPHTNYFSKHTSDNFKINMSLSLEGIGATLQTDNDYTKVVRIVPGGPADKSTLLHAEDRIVAVGQGEDGEMEDIMGWRLDDVVSLIRGDKGTTVRLDILPVKTGLNGAVKQIKIVREKVKLEDQEAKKEMIPITKNGKAMNMGIIKIPSFYFGWEEYQRGDEDYSSTSKDVKKLIKELQDEGMDGLVIDLRNNGGGSLAEAIELTGLFIDNGPVVQVRPSDPRRPIEVGRDSVAGVFYQGPLTVLINRFSASASEIFAGAIQDYKRGVIVGEQTFGKGTVQNVVDLARFIPEAKGEAGQLKLTLQKFYRVTGSSTQHKGVTPDIQLPSAFSAESFGESSEPSALPWDQIGSAEYEQANTISQKMLNRLSQMYSARLKTDPVLQDLVNETFELSVNINTKEVSLNEIERKNERKQRNNKETISGTTINTETGEAKAFDVPVTDKYLREGIIILAELVASNIG